MIESYEVVFEDISEIKPAEILARSFHREGKDYKLDIQKLQGRTVLKIKITSKNGNCIKFKRIFVSKECKHEFEKDTAVIVDYPGKDFHRTGKNVWCINASEIAERFSCSKEYPLLGAIARTGLISLHSIILEIYQSYNKMDAHKRALAVRRGFEGLKV